MSNNNKIQRHVVKRGRLKLRILIEEKHNLSPSNWKTFDANSNNKFSLIFPEKQTADGKEGNSIHPTTPQTTIYPVLRDMGAWKNALKFVK